jgi:hypothetical protein
LLQVDTVPTSTVLYVKESNSDPGFWGLTKNQVERLENGVLRWFVVLLTRSATAGYVLDRTEVNSRIADGTFELAGDGDYKINERPDLEGASAFDGIKSLFHRLISNNYSGRTCSLISLSRQITLDRFGLLHPDGRRLVQEWARRAQAVTIADDPGAYFEAFIYLWFAVNGWGACVADTDVDRQWVNAVAGDPELSAKFVGLLSEHADFKIRVHRFARLWPIFRSSDIRRHRGQVSERFSREERVAAYLGRRLNNFEPCCWHEHDGLPPLDWAHTFRAIYRVRCNLFHGEKTLNSENDVDIVRAACQVLGAFVMKTRVLD